MSCFVHLGIHSEYSITDSIVRIKSLVERAAEQKMPALALTDLSNIYAAVKFHHACHSKGIKPIFGSEIRLQDEHHTAQLLAMNDTGWHHLMELVSKGFTDGLKLDIPTIDKQWILEKNQGLILLLGVNSDVGEALCSANPHKAIPLLEQWVTHFGNRVYLALTRTQRANEERFIQEAVKLAEQFEIGLVAHNDIRFLNEDDFEAHEARVCISQGYTLADERRPRHYSPQQYFKTANEMANLFADLPDALTNSGYIAQRCTVNLNLGKNYLPDYPIPEGFDISSYFSHVSKQGLEERLAHLYPVAMRDENWEQQRKIYDDRLQFEIDVILKMGFPGYFLIVMDFIGWAKRNGVPVGPGRGSGAGSLVAYSLKITDLDPLKYDLLFERFLNPERVSMPDFDIDFCIAGRDRVIEYVAQHYGREAVAQIATFGTMAAKGVLRDVARVLGKSYGLADRLSKLIPSKPLGLSLAEAITLEPQLHDMVTNPNNPEYDDASEIWEMALKLEGITRNTGKHAGGVLIAPGKITDFSAVTCEADGTNRVSQFDKDDVEAVGLVKFDFLGLRNLTVIEEALTAINRKLPSEQQINISYVPLDDPQAYQVFANANTTAVFQFESVGMKRMLKEARPSKFEEIIAFVSLYRPGPMDLIPDFIHRMQGGEFEYLHPLLSEVLAPTYGIMVYQEQVMQTAQICAGYTLGGADLLRRAMGKKKPEEMEKQRQIFLAGAADKDIDADTANRIFDYMEKFAGYGFNKSHAAAYALVAYHTAWLKAHYPAEFMAAVLSSEMDNTDTVVFLIDDCRRNQLDVLPPSINRSDYRFKADDASTIVYGLGAIKGVGEQAIQSVIDARQRDGEFTDLFDFCHRIDLKKLNKRTLEALIRAGAMDCLNEERSTLMEHLPEAVQAAEQARQNRETGIMDLFGEVEEVQRKPTRPIKAWRDEVRLQGEKDTLGLYLTGHPIDVYHHELKQFIHHKFADFLQNKNAIRQLFAGFIIDIAHFPNRTVILLDDGTARVEINTKRERFERDKDKLILNQLAIIEGQVYLREGEERLFGRMNKVFSIHEIRQKRAEVLYLNCAIQQMDQAFLQDFQHILQQFRPQAEQLSVHLQLKCDFDFAECQLASSAWQVHLCEDLLLKLRDVFGKDHVFLKYKVKNQHVKIIESDYRLNAIEHDTHEDDVIYDDDFAHMSAQLQEPAYLMQDDY